MDYNYDYSAFIKKHIVPVHSIKRSDNVFVNLFCYTYKYFYSVISFFARKIYYRKGQIDKHKIIVATFNYRYSCNPKYIINEILRQKLPFDIVWVVNPENPSQEDFPPEIRTVPYGSFEMFEEMNSAGIWLDNSITFVWHGMPKKKEQLYLNTWHGSMGIKKITGNKLWILRSKACHKVTDYCITNSLYEENIFHATLWKGVPCLRFGHPRNDILFQREIHPLLRNNFLNRYGISLSNVKLLLFAPTFRDDGNMNWFNLDFYSLKQQVERSFGGNWIFLLRLHYKNRSQFNCISSNDWMIDITDYPDMQEILSIIDMGITDYSSWAYDYLLTFRPLFIYAPDIDQYNLDRGLYYPLSSTPFSVSTNQVELHNAIADFNQQRYSENVHSFLKEKGCYEDGSASKHVVDFIKKTTYNTSSV